MAQWGGFSPYVPVAERKKAAEKEIAALRKSGRTLTPIVIEGAQISRTFWGKAWCKHLESYSDYATRLPRGRSYVRSGTVVHLGITAGAVDALVRGSSMYTVSISVDALAPARWNAVAKECSGKVTSLVELLEGKLSSGVMEVVTHRDRGIFPSPREIYLDCSCPDHAMMCKHVAATLYGVGARLDAEPELLFLLRGVDPVQLVAKTVGRAARRVGKTRAKVIPADKLAGIFGIELDDGPEDLS
jgi:uncharacterized Zn finger protein